MVLLYGFLGNEQSANVRQNTPIFAPLVVKWWSNSAILIAAPTSQLSIKRTRCQKQFSKEKLRLQRSAGQRPRRQIMTPRRRFITLN
jgi:hypothetical protein